MTRDRLIQLLALLVFVLSVGAAGAVLPGLTRTADRYALRYTDVSIEGAPPIVAIGNAIGALRGLIVDYLWIKVHIQKEKGLFYEVMADADLITKLQPRFAAVWAFHGHNMAYNISVATHTEQERWEWVQEGIRLVRNQGIRYNPNDLELHKELAFWFAHKIEGTADDAHLYYKTQFCREWHLLLGAPPDGYEARIEWIKKVADAPDTLEDAEQRTPGVTALVDALRQAYPPAQARPFALDRDFLTQYTMWQVIRRQSDMAEILGAAERFRQDSAYFAAFDRLASDPRLQDQWDILVSSVRKRVLDEEYNMDAQLMYEYTRDLGPLDWRHGQAHALYWAARGAQFGEARVSDDEVYVRINNDRIQIQAMQGLARFGRIVFDPFSTGPPARFPDPRWIDTIERRFEHLYVKYYDTRGAGGDTFIGFLENFLSSAVREAYRAGEIERARRLLDRLDQLFGRGGMVPNDKYARPLDVFVREQTFDQYASQPHLAPSEVAAALRHGFLVGIVYNRPDVLRQSVKFADDVTAYFKGNEYYDFVNKFGVSRIGDIIGRLEDSAVAVFGQIMIDPSVNIVDRQTLWAQIDRFVPQLRVRAYDLIKPQIQSELANTPWGQRYSIDQILPEPPGMDAYRQQLAEERARIQRELEEQRQRGQIERH